MIDFNPAILLDNLARERRAIQHELRTCKRGTLIVQSTKSGPAFYLQSRDSNGRKTRKGIGKKPALVYQLAHRVYLEERLRRIDKNIILIRRLAPKLADTSPAAVVSGLPAKFSMLDRKLIISPDELTGIGHFCPHPSRNVAPVELRPTIGDLSVREWAEALYAENTKAIETKVHLTEWAVATRSKNEALIINIYDNLEILYHYDELVLINGKWRSPDIIAVRPDGTLFIHEHCGLQTEEYAANLEAKLQEYRLCGFELGRNLLLTFDDPANGINIPLIKMQIENMYNMR